MTANAPYYQMRGAGDFTTTNGLNAAPPQFVPEDDDHDPSASAAIASPLDHSLHTSYAEDAAPHTSANHTLEGNHNLVELLEAATAAGQAAEDMDMDIAVPVESAARGRNKRRRASSSPADGASSHADATVDSKRQKVAEPTDPQLEDGENNMRGISVESSGPLSSESLLDNARAAGVHSAAALFRPSSERTSRKYTRPPMSKLFMSLQLSPENFLQLQASAKLYMLSPAHPERQNCVGNRGKGDTDMVKLRLFNCVHDFLNGGVGEQFFGEHVEKPGETEAIEAARALGQEKSTNAGERLTWPKDGNKIIGLVTPLMRRMVTNERQRQYAIETRKGGTKKKDKEGSVEAPVQTHDITSSFGVEQQLQSALDPVLNQRMQSSQPTSPSTTTAATPRQTYYKDSDSAVAATKAPSDVKLPSSNPSEPNLSNINIFLVLASSGNKSSIKLDEKRITAEPQAHLAWYEYKDFTKEVVELVSRAKAKYPELRARSTAREDQPETGSLRGLAAAANALQTENTDGTVGTTSVAETSQRVTVNATNEAFPADPDASGAGGCQDTQREASSPARPVPLNELRELRYIVKSLGSDGWKVIHDEQDWYSVLREMAFAVWADGVCNVLVELISA